MNDTRTDLKAELMTQAEALIDELVEWTADTPAPTLTQIEDIVLKRRQRLSEQMALGVIGAQAAVRPVPGPNCPTCGREMHYKDRKANTGREALHGEAHYFDENQRRMQYVELREDGFPIGSGMVESGCKQFRARLNGPGMRWSRPGIERLLPVRADVMGHTLR